MERLQAASAVIEYQVRIKGEPVLLLYLSVVADGLAYPLFAQPELIAQYQFIHYLRRGYVGSTLGSAPLTLARQAADAAALVRHLGIRRAHVAGHSFGGLIALQLALAEPEMVHSLALLEPPLVVPSAQAMFAQTMLPMLDAYHSGNKPQAMDAFSDAVFGPGWRSVVEQAVPGGVEQAVRDLDTFILELPAIQNSRFGPAQASAIRQPLLSVLGTRTSLFMKKGRELLHSWFPQTEDFDMPTTHLLQMQDPKAVARALAGFISRHAMARHPMTS